MRRLAATVALLLAGCGAGEDEQRAGTRTPAASPIGELTIIAPADGSRVRGDAVGLARVGADVVVRGRAAPGRTILVRADCAATGCSGLARAKADWEWEVPLRVVVSRRRPRAVIEAEDSVAGRSATVTLRLRVPPQPKLEEPVPESGFGDEDAEETPTPTPTPARAQRPKRLIMIGDSLAVGTRNVLPGYLPGWRVSTDAAKSRTLAQGMTTLSPLSVDEPTVLAFSLFTNDDPRHLPALEAAVRQSVDKAGASGCAVWATISRPKYLDRGYGPVNARLKAMTKDFPGKLIVVPWAEVVRGQPELLERDRIHATPQGYEARAQLFAEAATACGR